MSKQADIGVLRELARQYAEIAGDPIQEQRRRLWADHNSLRATRPPILATFGMWNVWCREVFGDAKMKCEDPFYRNYERWLRMEIFHFGYGDDAIQEPWATVGAVQKVGWHNLWGVELQHENSSQEGGAWRFDPVLRDWSDVAKLVPPPHVIDEAATAENIARLSEAIGDILTINIERNPACMSFPNDISTHLAQMRGLEQLMMDMCSEPEKLHGLLAFMRDGILANQAAAERAGDMSLTGQTNQCFTYSNELPWPKPNVRGVNRKQLWGFSASQELTLVSPAMHEEFMLRYQRPIMEHFGLSHYGCCEDLTRKIDILRKVRNLRIIAISPRADVARCAEQIGGDYVMSWRPNPSDMVCCGFNEEVIRRIFREALAAMRGSGCCCFHVHLKDIETLEGDLSRMKRWVTLAREMCEEQR